MSQMTASQPANGLRTGLDAADRVEAAFRRARRHSGLVRLLKISLPLVALAMIAAFAGRALMTETAEPLAVAEEVLESGRVVMSSPTLDGFTSDDRAYSLRAGRAVRDIAAAGLIDLHDIEASLVLESGVPAFVEAASGTLHEETRLLDFTSELTVVTEDGMTARFGSARIDLVNGAMTAADPVDIDLGHTRIAADSLAVRDNGASVVFDGKVRVEMDVERIRGAQEGEGGGSDD